MTTTLDKILDIISARLPREDADWIEDMRLEAQHVTPGVKRMIFSLGSLRAALAVLLKTVWGIRRVGQTLLGLTVLSVCIGALFMMQTYLEAASEPSVLILLGAYSLGGILVLTHLDWAKRFSLIAGTAFAIGCLALFLPIFEGPRIYLRALLFEGAIIMTLLHIAASFVDWSGEAADV